jgi:hypothetical protein
MLKALLAGEEDPRRLAAHARGRLMSKREQLEEALRGRITPHHLFLLREALEHFEMLEQRIERFCERIAALQEHEDAAAQGPRGPGRALGGRAPGGAGSDQTAAAPSAGGAEPPGGPAQRPGPTAPGRRLSHAEALTKLKTIPGVGQKIAEVLIAEVGLDMDQFGSPERLASWGGLCPGNNQSAGKRLSGKTRKGSRFLRSALCEAAWAAWRMRQTFLHAQFNRLQRRRGSKRAALAVAHTILRMAYCILKEGTSYQELGADYYDRLHPTRLTRYLVRRLEGLGYRVTLQSA